ncbi:hypothetical protein ITZ04_000775 [Escherichia coli]|nr:hypothetical protein [Escherichia coli]
MKEFKGSPHPWHWEGDKLCDSNHMIINGGKFKFKKWDKALVTAAPELLEALQTIQAKMSDFIKLANEVGINDADGFYLAAATGAEEQARAAISKALGEE